jgi:hypothetical protein
LPFDWGDSGIDVLLRLDSLATALVFVDAGFDVTALVVLFFVPIVVFGRGAFGAIFFALDAVFIAAFFFDAVADAVFVAAFLFFAGSFALLVAGLVFVVFVVNL